MELDALREIMLRLEDLGVIKLKLLSKKLSELTNKIENDQEYWRKRLSNYLGFEVFERAGGKWKKNIQECCKK